MPTRIIVAGIYRSGTSLNAELVHRWGAYAGQKEDIFEDQFGYLEHLALQKLNDELLDNNSRVPPEPEQLLERASQPHYQERALQILAAMDKQAEEQQAVAWVWKDPRLPLVLPFWEKLWGEVVYVLPVRHPAETVLSGANMEGVPAEQVPFSAGFAYWQYCMLNVVTCTANNPRKIFIAYDQLVQHPQHECARLCQFLDEHCGLTTGADQRIQAMLPQVSTSQHHFQYPKSFGEIEQATREQRALYNFLRAKTINPEEAFQKEDFAIYPGWKEYLQTIDLLLTMGSSQEA
jgi:hypothetical protein